MTALLSRRLLVLCALFSFAHAADAAVISTRVGSTFTNPAVGLAYHSPTNQIIVSVNYPTGAGHNFEIVAANGVRTPYSSASGFIDEIYMVSPRDSHDGFTAGELFVGTGVGGRIARISADGSTVTNPWVTLPGESGLLRGGLHFDETGIFGHDLLVVTTTGTLWRVTAAGAATRVSAVPNATPVEGLLVVPDDARYGPWRGRAVTCGINTGQFYAFSTVTNAAPQPSTIPPITNCENLNLVRAGETFFAADFDGALWRVDATEFAGMDGDIVVGEEFRQNPAGNFWRVRWDATQNKFTVLSLGTLGTAGSELEAAIFAPTDVNHPPLVTCTSPGPAECSAGAASNTISLSVSDQDGDPLTVTWSVDGAVTATHTLSSGSTADSFTDTFAFGSHIVSAQVGDGNGGTATCQAAVDVVDSVGPTLMCPADSTAECTGNKAANVTPGSATASDVCTAPTVSGPAAGSYPLGTTTVAYHATDGAGNTSTCSSKITVVDTTNPTITCPAPVTAECTGNASAAVNPGSAIASDVCSTVSFSPNNPRAGAYPLGTTTTTYAAIDESANGSSCNSSVTVVDTTAPSITCPAPITSECTGNQAAVVTPGRATATDVCTQVIVSSLATGAYPLGTTAVSYSATDQSGLSSSCTTSITVADTTKPSITCPAPVTAECTGMLAAYVDPGNATASDVCSPTTVTNPGAATYPLGTTTVSFSAQDTSGNTNSCASSVTVADTTAPSISCPAPLVVECTANASANVTPLAATATDVCSAVTISGPAAGAYPLGSTSVTYSASDQSGLTTSCSSFITVQDTRGPSFDLSTLGSRTLVGTCSSTPLTIAPPSATDICTGSSTVQCSSVPGNSFGANTATCTATDASGHTTTATVPANVLQPLRVAFAPPLADDNAPNDVATDADVNNLFRSGQTVPHKVKLFDCAGNDVTSTAPVTVRLVVARGANGGGTDLINDVDDFAGIGDVGGLMRLVDSHYQFNLKTNTTEYPAGGNQFQSLVTVTYTSAPGLVAGTEDARLVSR